MNFTYIILHRSFYYLLMKKCDELYRRINTSSLLIMNVYIYIHGMIIINTTYIIIYHTTICSLYI